MSGRLGRRWRPGHRAREPGPWRPASSVAAVLVATAAGAWIPAPLAAQIDVGGQFSWAAEVADGTFGIGGRIGVGLGPEARGLRVLGAFDWFFPDDFPVERNFWDATLDLVYDLPVAGVTPYFGAGLTHQSSEVETDSARETGFNLVAGSRLGRGFGIGPFLELRHTLMDDLEDQLIVSFGVLF